MKMIELTCKGCGKPFEVEEIFSSNLFCELCFDPVIHPKDNRSIDECLANCKTMTYKK